MSPHKFGPLSFKLAAFTLALGALLTAPRPARAQSSSGSGSGALVLQGCPNTTTFFGRSDGLVYQVCADIVFTPNGGVNATFHGALLDPATAPSQALIVSSFPCAYNGQITHDSQLAISPDGTVNGYCKLHTN